MHYVCQGDCKGVSKDPKVCETEGCKNKGEPLELCDCESDEHKVEEGQ